jgi:hypothetical protein
MSETWPITEWGTLLLRQHGAIDLRGLHKSLYNWATENNYFFNEKGFTEKVKSHGNEFEISWEFERRVTEFIKFKIIVGIWAHGMNPIKIEDKEVSQGDIEVVFDTYMEMDWQNRWESSPLHKFFRSIYIYYLKKDYFLNYAGKIWSETYELHAMVKTHLNQLALS